MRMVGFRSHQQNQLVTYHADAKPVALHNCELKPARQSLELEQYGTYSRAVTNFAKTHLNKIFDKSNLTKDFPNGIYSAKVVTNPVTMFQGTNYNPPSATLAVGEYPNQTQFPGGTGFKSLKVE